MCGVYSKRQTTIHDGFSSPTEDAAAKSSTLFHACAGLSTVVLFGGKKFKTYSERNVRERESDEWGKGDA